MTDVWSGLPERLLIGLSGGADSVALAHILLFARGGAEGLSAVHVNHGLRGEASDEDEAFVREYCRKHGLPLLVYRAEPPAHPGENWAREVRWSFFRQAMAETGAEALALAHHRGDQAETVLMRLLRGSGLSGLGGMSPDTAVMGIRVVRPLLNDFDHEMLCTILRAAGQDWREDASNESAAYLRNRVRLELLPLMEKLLPGAGERIVRSADSLRADGALLDSMAETLLAQSALGGALRLEHLHAAPRPVRIRALRLWWLRTAGQDMDERALGHAQTERLEALVQLGRAGGKTGLPGGWTAYRGWRAVHLKRDGRREEAELPLKDGAELCGVRLRLNPDPGHPAGKDAVPAEDCRLRTRRPGDWLKVSRGAHTRSLQDWLVDCRVDAPWRDRIPLLCRGNEVLCVPGLTEEMPAVTDENGQTLLVSWEGELPWAAE